MVTSLQQPPRGQGCPHSHPTRNPELRTRNPLARPVPIFFLIAATRCNKLQPGATPGQNRRSGAATLNSVFGVPPSGGGQIPRSGATLTFKPETCLRSQAAFIRHKATQPGTVTWLNGYIVTTTPTRTRLSALPSNTEPGTQNPEPLARIRFKCQRTAGTINVQRVRRDSTEGRTSSRRGE